jgi:predicted nuclease of predicted toxin-antitoxin system
MCWILGMAQSRDTELWSFAVENKFALISKDYDFLHFLERRRLTVS